MSAVTGSLGSGPVDAGLLDGVLLDLGVPGDGALAVAGGPGWAAEVVTETATPSPSDDPLREDLEPTDVSPGLAGFLAIFAVALAAVALFFALSRQLRRMRHNAEVQGIGPDGPITGPAGSTAPDGAGGDGGAAPGDGRTPGDGPAPGDGRTPGGDATSGTPRRDA
ncbi:hypothetical protein [Cellulosimicrobium sp. Marseille-Q4280]|uniref:hypothetical protein n=1 Tax=Cellulosimicrobium sp. Marseille-Q4280 TaxID=2937992 RepID=UPI002042397F|nr:hypothetical protein [Cellulosimicrobium sp. Marseille-Q4280]